MNLVLIILDSLRKDHVGCYGNTWIETPNLDALARESVVFDNAYPESLPTLPQRRAMHTGLRTFPFRGYHSRKGDMVKIYGWEPIPEEQVTLAEILRKEGYNTCLICDTYHCFKPSMNFHRGFNQFHWIRGQEIDKVRRPLPRQAIEDVLLPWMMDTAVETILRQYMANVGDRKSEEDYFAARVFLTASEWLEENRTNQPFFLVIDCFDPHEPWDPPEEYWRKYDPDYNGKRVTMPLYGTSDFITEPEIKNMRANYAGEVTLVDKYLGRFLDKIRSLNLMDSTLLLLISDHGHQLGEHGLIGKVPPGMHPELIDLVMMIRHPDGTGAQTRVSELVYNVDQIATALNLLGVEPPNPLDGRDFWSLVTGTLKEPWRDHVISGFQDYVWLRNEYYSIISRNNGTNQSLFDLRSDIGQFHNIASEAPEVVSEMFQQAIEDAGGSLPMYYIEREMGEWYQPLRSDDLYE
jgi:arylsulfatase A-like enzyme